jgi:hypothetical protein
MEEVMTFDAEDNGFPLSRDQDTLPPLLAHIFQLFDVVYFEETPVFATVFTDISLESLL